MISDRPDNNSSTDAVADVYQEDRDDLDMQMDYYNEDLDIQRFPDDSQGTPLNSSENPVPPEYRNEPEIWYAIQASLKVSHLISDLGRSIMPSRILRWKSMVSKHIICAVSLKFVMRL
jgi:hypothetical protein